MQKICPSTEGAENKFLPISLLNLNFAHPLHCATSNRTHAGLDSLRSREDNEKENLERQKRKKGIKKQSITGRIMTLEGGEGWGNLV